MPTADVRPDPIIAEEAHKGLSTITPPSDMADHDNDICAEGQDPVDWEFWLVPEALSEDPLVFPKRLAA